MLWEISCGDNVKMDGEGKNWRPGGQLEGDCMVRMRYKENLGNMAKAE